MLWHTNEALGPKIALIPIPFKEYLMFHSPLSFVRKKGFTLIELLVVIAIIAILAERSAHVLLKQRKTNGDCVYDVRAGLR